MDTIILGGDARMPALAGRLRREGRDALHVADANLARSLLPEAEVVVTNCPPKLDNMLIEEIMTLARPDARIFLCGPGSFEGDARVTDLWKDEKLLMENAWLTAEGAVSAAMRAGRTTLRGMVCGVIGWGRIGGALTEYLVALGAKVTVASRSEAHRNRAIERGAEAVSIEALPEILPKLALIFSTPPALVMDAGRLEKVNRDAMVIDLASPPFGVDLHAAWRMGLRAWREPGLPGRYCPESAAEALLRAMERGDAR